MIFRRGRFRELVDRQLDLFASETDLLDEAAAADATWSDADADETYAATLDESAADDYRAAFDRATRKRFGRLAAFLE